MSLAPTLLTRLVVCEEGAILGGRQDGTDHRGVLGSLPSLLQAPHDDAVLDNVTHGLVLLWLALHRPVQAGAVLLQASAAQQPDARRRHCRQQRVKAA
jgi:hypothetical protein